MEGDPDLGYSYHLSQVLYEMDGHYSRKPTVEEAEQSLRALLDDPEGALRASHDRYEEISRRMAERVGDKYPYIPRPFESETPTQHREAIDRKAQDRLVALENSTRERPYDKEFTTRELLVAAMMEPEVNLLRANMTMENLHARQGADLIHHALIGIENIRKQVDEAADGLHFLAVLLERRTAIRKGNSIILDEEDLETELTALRDKLIKGLRESQKRFEEFEVATLERVLQTAVSLMEDSVAFEERGDRRAFRLRIEELLRYQVARGKANPMLDFNGLEGTKRLRNLLSGEPFAIES